jgi:amino acid permease
MYVPAYPPSPSPDLKCNLNEEFIYLIDWTVPYRFTNQFGNGTESYISDPSDAQLSKTIGGSLGQFLAVWKAMTIAAFSFVGVEILAVCASEVCKNLPQPE